MSKQFLKVRQIYFQPEQLPLCEFTPLENKDCEVYFENAVISDLIGMGDHESALYYGVVSWNLKNKIKSPIGPAVRVKSFDAQILNDRLLGLSPDILGLVQYHPHDPVTYFPTVHKGMAPLFEAVCWKIGLSWKPSVLKDVFYSNHFIAKTAIYERYVREILDPAIRVMQDMPELMADSGYPRALPVDLRLKWGIAHYPFHAFICERLFSYWVSLNEFNVKYY